MARSKRSSRILDKAQRRSAGMQSIDDKLDLGPGMTMELYSQSIDNLRNRINAYNKTLSYVDELQNEVDKAERLLAIHSEQMLLGVAARYGKDSNEYEMAGGVKKSDRKRPTRRVASVTTSP
ncbi:hypothetical protein [Leptolyngbya sp. BC1307]|uniref:hypothetical protein n=1 Tax=Leptolyngbya sp. BC1307 TaxID=2029589 RepID=UPI000EFB6685|nr:hypothetical protein [Leptolyngbya sp. BC1307]